MLSNYFHKGNRIAVEGRINTGSYEKDGQRIYTTDVLVNRVHFIESAKENRQQGFNQQHNQPQGMNQQGFGPQDANAGYYPIDNNEVPF